MVMREQIPMKPAAPPVRSFMPAHFGTLQRQCACGGSGTSGGGCEECKKKKQLLQRREASGRDPATVPPIVHDVLRSPGQPLDPATRAFFEPRFGHDFSRVRVHAGEQAAESAGAVNALAFTLGRNIVFGHGQYSPATDQGRMLLAHELTHVLQQDGHEPVQQNAGYRIGPTDDAYEREASNMATSVLAARPAADTATHGKMASPGATAGTAPSPLTPQFSAGPYIARAPCLNPDICAAIKKPKDCDGGRCGYQGSGQCHWMGLEGGCCCIGAKERPKEKVPVPDKLKQILPAWIVAVLGAAMIALLVACIASGACEVGAILAGAGAVVGAGIIAALRAAGINVKDSPKPTA
jgi:hypothetical protein